ncbi:MAG: NAD-dependent succinate-semialdehyde dehydrogenase [Alphaproteobacteria bacterium]|nr:NAD-dependent succinate-semialdehyde dehydrogenase [Alphaproteobacteria bacterium]MCZ6763770.1 NAD-dependent succinate-semialdehyde dehydrogenase [Alphaproteobacteria bacterium]
MAPDGLPLPQTGLHIGGAWRNASDGGTIDVINPATEAVLASVASATAEDGMAAVDAAYDAGPAWAATAPRERAEILRRSFELMIARKEEVAQLIVRENGKAMPDALGETVYAAEFFRWYAEEAVRNISDLYTAPSGANRIMVVQQPVGVSLLITPWNFPAAMGTRKIGPALAAGCTVILKPASETPLTALLISEILSEAGVPDGVVNVLSARGSSGIIEKMLQDPRVRKLSFTGSTQVGRVLLAQAAQSIVNCSMELGGNAPFIVFADADIDAAVEGAMIAKMRNGGEACTAANRFYVQTPVIEEFSEKFGAAMAALKVGPGLDAGVQLGPLVNAESRDKVAGFVADAIERGAKLVTGGNAIDGRGYFYAPTVLTNVDPDSELCHDEIFGPVAPIIGFETVDEAVARANDTEYGLISYIYTQDIAKGLAVAERIESGMVGLNRGVVSDPAAPFGGMKQSGIGREGAHDGMLEFLEKKYIALSW